MPTPQLQLDAASTAVVFIECQNGVIGADGALPELAAAAAPRVPAMAELARGARAAGALVVHLTYAPALNNRSSNRAPVMFGHVLPLMQDWNLDHPATQVVDEIGVAESDLVMPRHSGLSPTYRTELFPILRNAGCSTVVLAGVSLNIAVPVVAAQAVDEGFPTVVARDAVAGTPVEHAQSMLRHTVAHIARLATVAEILQALG